MAGRRHRSDDRITNFVSYLSARVRHFLPPVSLAPTAQPAAHPFAPDIAPVLLKTDAKKRLIKLMS